MKKSVMPVIQMDQTPAPLLIGDARKSTAPVRLAGRIEDLAERLRPARPLYVTWPERLGATCRAFLSQFPGETMYAVKANPDKLVIQTLYRNGMRAFDCASVEEIRMVRKLAPKARIYFMHPVKAPEAIYEAYHNHGVRAFVLDCKEELYKILRETGMAPDLNLFVRLAPPKNESAGTDFSSKFGARGTEAVELFQLCRPVASALGVCFHVGTQTSDPNVYGRAVHFAAALIRESGVQVDMMDVGGGFAVPYPDAVIPSLSDCVASLQTALREEGLSHLPLLCEPGRAMVSEAVAMVVRVEQRKGDLLYLNDGTYGGLFEAGSCFGCRYPVKAIRGDGALSEILTAYRFAGPTCDSVDMMQGPFMLPDDIEAGDFVIIYMIGAYGHASRSNFNGFGKSHAVALYDLPEMVGA